MKVKISVSKYNEVNPKELKYLFGLGARLIKSKCAIGVKLGTFNTIKGGTVTAYADDSIEINGVTLNLSTADDDYYNCVLSFEV